MAVLVKQLADKHINRYALDTYTSLHIKDCYMYM